MRRDLGVLILVLTFAVIAIGLVALYSASYQNARVSQKIFYDQMVFSVIGLFMLLYLSKLDYRKFYDLAYLLYGGSVLLLILVLVSGRHALGAQRWFTIAGISFQPSELAKLTLIFGLGRYFSDRRSALSARPRGHVGVLWHDLFVPLVMTLVPMLLIFKQPDLGTALLFFGIFIFMLFASGLRYRYILGFLLICLMVMPFGWHVIKPYQKDRLLVFLNPNIDPLGAGYTIIQSKIAVGSGRLWGKGWLSGTQNQLNFLPERHTDFIFSVIGEEWGLLGTLILLVCYGVLIHAGLKVAEQVKDRFGMQMAVGITGIFSLQVLINIGMVLGMCPVVGLTLPLISYGRTSSLMFLFMIGILLNLSKRRTIF